MLKAETAEKANTNDLGIKTIPGTDGLTTRADVSAERTMHSVQFNDEAKMHGEGRKVINSQKRGSLLFRGLDTSDAKREAKMVGTRFRDHNGGGSVLSSIRAEKNQEYKLMNKESFGAGILKVIQKKDAS